MRMSRNNFGPCSVKSRVFSLPDEKGKKSLDETARARSETSGSESYDHICLKEIYSIEIQIYLLLLFQPRSAQSTHKGLSQRGKTRANRLETKRYHHDFRRHVVYKEAARESTSISVYCIYIIICTYIYIYIYNVYIYI